MEQNTKTEEVHLAVRPFTAQDLPSILQYWQTRSEDNLLLMGVDSTKLQSIDFSSLIMSQLHVPFIEKTNFFVIWTINDQAVGHSNIGKITFGEEATMHLHIWQPDQRRRGVGQFMVIQSLMQYFKLFQLKRVICEPNAVNEAPNKTLARVGFEFVQEYQPEPGLINFPHTQKRWEMTKERFEKIHAVVV